MNNEHPANRIRKAGIIGQGKMGTGIFNYLLDFGLELVWVCSPGADTDKIYRQFAKRTQRSLDTGIIDQQRFDQRMKTTISRNYTDMYNCDLVIEAVPEIIELKKDLFFHLDKIVKPEAIFTSNSSSINPSEMVPPGNRIGKFAGLHFFYPVSLKNIVEFTVTNVTAGETITRIESFLDEIGRRFITLDEKNSFMLNKIFLDFQNEAFLIVQAGNCTYLQMDQLVKTNIFPFGVFDFCDSVGLDTMLSSIRNYTHNYPHQGYFAGLLKTLTDMVSQGRLGIKSREGFYKYPMEELPVDIPVNASDIIDHLRQIWLSSSKRFTALAHIPIDDANHAIREYFNVDKGPFE